MVLKRILRPLGIRNLHTVATDLRELRTMLLEVKVHSGL
jgi:hypothetical protein